MSWVITEDLIGHGEDSGVYGPGGTDLTPEQIQNHPEAKAFEMYDDDKELYYRGFWVDDKHASSELDPLDDFGMPNAGAVLIKVGGRFI